MSNYHISITQTKSDDDYFIAKYDHFILIIVLGILCIVITIVLSILWMWYIFKKLDQLGGESQVKPLPVQLERVEFIVKCLENMRSGKFSSLPVKYNEDLWVICLDPFADDACVHATNECSHVFHSEWLNRWFRNIYCHKDLIWPHWTTKITDQSQKPPIEIDDEKEEGASR